MVNSISQFLHNQQIDIEYLLQFVLKKPKTFLYSNPDYILNEQQINQLNTLNKKRNQGVPLAQLIAKKSFYHLDFFVNENVLIPREDTEVLVDVALNLFADNQAKNILELATGSGAIAVVLSDKKPHWQLLATDISIKALAVAAKNLTLTQYNNIALLASDWFSAISIEQKFDLIIVNPPYIAPDDMHLKALKFEPVIALVAQNNGLADYQIIISQAKHYLKPDGYLLLEHGYNQQGELLKLLKNDFHPCQTFDDLGGNERAILAQIR